MLHTDARDMVEVNLLIRRGTLFLEPRGWVTTFSLSLSLVPPRPPHDKGFGVKVGPSLLFLFSFGANQSFRPSRILL